MLFNSLQFVFFYVVVTILYFSLRHRGRIWLLLLASSYFYLVFKPVYILILLVTIIVDYFAGIWISKSEGKKRKLLLVLSLITNIGFLGFFKYWNFINKNISAGLALIGIENPLHDYPFDLPIGLSFHTFQAMSYTIEVYRRKQKTEKDFIVYSLYVMFYPQLVAGPIERPQNLLHQFHTNFKYSFANLKAGLMQMAWGMFKKVVIADRLSILVDYCYDNPSEYSGLTMLIATIFFTIQIYCDFSGYSDIAIGAARTMGFDLMMNFDSPYLSKSISEFWRRWHISLSTWFKDYLYIPLGGNRVGQWRLYANYMIVFTVSGLWHGAAWTFIIWGALHGLYLVLAIMRERYLPFKLPKLPFLSMLFTFILVMITWVFFRAKGLFNAKIILSKIFSLDYFRGFEMPFSTNEFIFCWFLMILLFVKDIYFRKISTEHTPAFYFKFVGLLLVCYFFGVFGSNQFIYFQF
ncbi:MBOAT family protein [Lacihabitans sp. LS3-19]|uniref:MBOAT family O-acyltransferase n=1 Tax=Lacihabitans sp. LS3-19 TaxID=2487335 RepID=UPI0020CF2740|nr:MBOAT family O-acyltransferase [Lacihabitans sp. LS3-19]MCP9770970.1 MBOAT family protein [Lacihabitans sp. LS3-19]